MAFPSIPSPNPAALALGLGAILLAPRRPAAAGALAGLAVVFRVDVGLAAVGGAMLAALPSGDLRVARREAARAAARVAGAAAAVAVVLLAPVVLAAPREAWEQTLGFALDEQGLQRLPLPGAYDGSLAAQQGARPLLPLRAARRRAAVGGPRPARADRAAAAGPPRRWRWPARPTCWPARTSSTSSRWPRSCRCCWPSSPPARAARATRSPSARPAPCSSLVALHGLDEKRIQALSPPPLERLDVDVADGVKAPTAEARALAALVAYVRARVPEGEPVFVANPRHDLVKVGNPLLYVLLQRDNPTRYDVFQPGVVTSAPVQREMVRDLERARPEIVVRWLSPVASQPEPNGAGRSSGVRILDRYLARHYAAGAALRRLRGPAPALAPSGVRAARGAQRAHLAGAALGGGLPGAVGLAVGQLGDRALERLDAAGQAADRVGDGVGQVDPVGVGPLGPATVDAHDVPGVADDRGVRAARPR